MQTDNIVIIKKQLKAIYFSNFYFLYSSTQYIHSNVKFGKKKEKKTIGL